MTERSAVVEELTVGELLWTIANVVKPRPESLVLGVFALSQVLQQGSTLLLPRRVLQSPTRSSGNLFALLTLSLPPRTRRSSRLLVGSQRMLARFGEEMVGDSVLGVRGNVASASRLRGELAATRLVQEIVAEAELRVCHELLQMACWCA